MDSAAMHELAAPSAPAPSARNHPGVCIQEVTPDHHPIRIRCPFGPENLARKRSRNSMKW